MRDIGFIDLDEDPYVLYGFVAGASGQMFAHALTTTNKTAIRTPPKDVLETEAEPLFHYTWFVLGGIIIVSAGASFWIFHLAGTSERTGS
ncbi:MAG: hypothetical protein O2960_13910 [Verrucomicrobia bacterium]|nr:hypothetical protein [Verrucomicrobiota bacterium]